MKKSYILIFVLAALVSLVLLMGKPSSQIDEYSQNEYNQYAGEEYAKESSDQIKTSCLSDLDNDGVINTEYEFLLVDSEQECFDLGGAPGVGFNTRLINDAAATATEASYDESNLKFIGYTAGGAIPESIGSDIIDSGVPDGGESYGPGKICHDYADLLEQDLTGRGYDATFTALSIVLKCTKYEKISKFSNRGVNKSSRWKRVKTFFITVFTHAINDIHNNGETYWVEPQTGKQVDLDTNNDGEVETFSADQLGDLNTAIPNEKFSSSTEGDVDPSGQADIFTPVAEENLKGGESKSTKVVCKKHGIGVGVFDNKEEAVNELGEEIFPDSNPFQ